MPWTACLSPWGISLPFLNLRSKSATTVVKLLRGRMPALGNLTLLSLERTRGNQQMKWKLRKLLAPKESYLGVLPLVDHSLSIYLLPQFVDHKPPLWKQFLDGLLGDLALLGWICNTESYFGTDWTIDWTIQLYRKNNFPPIGLQVNWIEQING